jgi:hypothetical protein
VLTTYMSVQTTADGKLLVPHSYLSRVYRFHKSDSLAGSAGVEHQPPMILEGLPLCQASYVLGSLGFENGMLSGRKRESDESSLQYTAEWYLLLSMVINEAGCARSGRIEKRDSGMRRGIRTTAQSVADEEVD